MNNKMKSIFFLLISISFLYSCQSATTKQIENEHSEHGNHSSEHNIVSLTPQQQKTLQIQLGTIEQKTLHQYIKISGKLAVPPQYRAEVSTFKAGNIKSIKVREGDYVQKGQVLAYIQNPDFIELQQEYRELSGSLSFLEQEYKRKATLFDKNVSSAKAFQKAKMDYKKAKTQYNGLKEKLLLLSLNPAEVLNGKTTSFIAIKAPISGYINNVHVSIGQYVSPEKGLFDLTDNAHVFADFKVYEQDLPQVKLGTKIQFVVANYPHKTIEAKVTSIGKQLDEDTRSIHIHADILSKETTLIPGMFIHGQLIANQKEANVLPQKAIIEDQNKYYVFIKDTLDQQENTQDFKMIEIEKGQSNQDYTAIKLISPLPKDTKFVIHGAYYLHSDMLKQEFAHD